ncbi:MULTISPECIES: ABC transporter substrate-binding protein [Marinomonas]|uniref:ABC transporter substrate-binding protein n=1 Tax=Marinomonas rhodophyticola TaxID=2992803 RepID=A0ABT3KJ58_9GAMM|nr:ABC transporter substrate-binding protein [Marinomonas sp. KJ51-3]MCW4630591.1 ABC transporter substrate-binding protein [Marinomonas sp. KJ51-3]
MIRFHQIIVPFLVGIMTLCGSIYSHSAQTITLGMSSAFSGDNASMGEDFLAGAQAGFARFHNRTGHTIELTTLDDAYDPRQTAPNTRRLIKEEKVTALFGNLGTPTVAVSAPIATETKTLLFAPVTGSSIIRPKTPDRYIINYRASYEEEITAAFDALMKKYLLKESDIALFNQKDMFGNTSKNHLTKLMQKYGIQHQEGLFQMEYSRNTLAVEHAVADLLIRHPTPKVIFIVGSAAPSAKFIRLTRQYGLDPLFIGISFMSSRLFIEELQDVPAKIIISQVVPHFEEKSLPIIVDFHQDMTRFSPQNPLTPLSLEGYIAARIFTTALLNTEHINHETIIDALESLNQFDIGLGVPLTLSPAEHQASHSIWLTQLKDGKLIPIPFTKVPTLYLSDIMPLDATGKAQ